MENNTCFFLGSKKLPEKDIEKILKQLDDEISNLIKNGVTNFICSGNIGFDMIVASFIIIKKEQGHDVKLIFALPYKGYASKWKFKQKELIANLILEADEVNYISDIAKYDCIKKQYDYMIGKSKHCICCMLGNTSEVNKWLQIAINNEINIVEIN